jgi:ABC-2 type transport system permease protein
MLALIVKTIYTKRRLLFINIIICALLIWLFVIFFPHMYEQSETLSEAFENYPDAFLQAFNVDVSQLFLSLEAFLAAEHFSLMWPIILIVFIISLGGSAIAGEVDDGTIEILLAQPLSRTKIYFSKYIAGLVILVAFIVISNFSVVPFALVHKVDFDIGKYVLISILGFFFAFGIYSFSMMLSAIFSSKGKVSAVLAGTILGMYAINLLSTFKESVENLRYLSYFYYFDTNNALIEGHINVLSFIIFILTGVIFILIGLIAFKKRDIAT